MSYLDAQLGRRRRRASSALVSAFSGILGPDGRVIGTPLIDDEGIVYAEIDLSRCIQPRQMHDITGHYNRFDIFDLRVNRKALASARFLDSETAWIDEQDAGGAAVGEASEMEKFQ